MEIKKNIQKNEKKILGIKLMFIFDYSNKFKHEISE